MFMETMWKRSLCVGYRPCLASGSRSKGIWSFHDIRSCSSPALPAGRITALEAVDFWKRHFEKRGVTEPEQSSQHIIAHLLGAKTIQSLEQGRLTEFLSPEKTEQVWQLCTRRLSRMPVQYVIEEWDFRDLTLKMRPPVFIPRPETEELVELVLTDFQRNPGMGLSASSQQTCLEVGCGSGAISLSLLKSLPQLKAFALDQSQDAVDLTRENALRLGLQDRLQTYHIDVMKDAETVLRFFSNTSALVSNPPYLFSEDMASLEPEIFSRKPQVCESTYAPSSQFMELLACFLILIAFFIWDKGAYMLSHTWYSLIQRPPRGGGRGHPNESDRFEDHSALDGGEDGLNVVKKILTLAPHVLSNHGRVYLEVDPRHPPLIRDWVEVNVEELQYVETRNDINGRPRFSILQKEKSNKDHKLDQD